MQDELLRLMINFKLCFQIPGARDTYIAPQLLSENQPEYDWDEADNLQLRYTYAFMPKGILTQFIVAMNKWIAEQKYVWKSGVILEKDRTKAEVIEHYGKREVQVRVAGRNRKELLTLVNYELDKIHDAYNRLKYDKLIPCNCVRCKDSQDPHFYLFDVLRDFVANSQHEIQCQRKPYKMVNVLGLIDDVLQKRTLFGDRREMRREESGIDYDETLLESEPEIEPEEEVFISYAWGGESEEIVDELDKAFQEKEIPLVRDKRDLGFKGRIKGFMEEIGRGKCVIVVISKKYLESENCMFELVQIAKNGGFYDRIFPIVLDDAKIYKAIHRVRYIKHWEDQIQELEEALKDVGAANLPGLHKDIDLYTKIRHTIDGLTDTLRDMNALTAEMHHESGFAELIDAVVEKVTE